MNWIIHAMKHSPETKPYILRIAGINHFDPTIRQKLLKWLDDCSSKYGKPDFVALEWDKKVFEGVKAKREEFQRLLMETWPAVSKTLLNTLTLSLGYEGDAHLEVYPDVEILWLDEGRKQSQVPEDYPKHYVETCARNLFKRYDKFLGEWPDNECDSSVLARLSRAASAVPQTEFDNRDAKFAGLIKSHPVSGRHGWAIAIVGRDHARRNAGSMRVLLEKMSYTCEVFFLTQEGTSVK
jgi:hypothetical protein